MPRRIRTLLVLLAVFATLLPAGTTHGHPSHDLVPNQPRGRVLFPSNRLTVRDSDQLTGRRLDFKLPNCRRQPSLCNERSLLNQLDGFDLDPLIVVQLEAPPNFEAGPCQVRLCRTLKLHHFYVQEVGDDRRIAVNRLVYNPRNKRLYGHPMRQLREGTTYRVVWNGTGPASEQRFTTLSATRVLTQMRRQLDSGKAYERAGIAPGERGIDFNLLPEDGRAVFDVPDVTEIARYQDDTKEEELTKETILTSSRAARLYAFGVFNSPQWLTANRFIPHTPTKTGAPRVRGSEQVGVTVLIPVGAMPDGGWPTAIFAPGITRSKYDLFLAADANAERGIATVSFDPVGHNFGPETETGVTTITGGGEVRFPGFGRAKVVDEHGLYDPTTNVSAPSQPHRLGAVALRDGLRQTAADTMALIRAIERGVDVDGDGAIDLRPDNVGIYAQSLGGIYGTLLSAVDPEVEVAALNVPGGPIADIAALAPGFRPEVSASLGKRQPSLLNGGLDCFTESAPLWAEGPVTKPARGALKIQQYASRSNWLNRPGSPEAFAPALRMHPLAGQDVKRVMYQFAHGDKTVPNPTSATLMRAGHLAPHTTYYRNDLTPTRDTNPHGFLLDPRIAGRQQAQEQIAQFLVSNGETIIDPDGAGPTYEVPITSRDALEQLNYNLEAEVQSRDQYNGPGCPEPGREQ